MEHINCTFGVNSDRPTEMNRKDLNKFYTVLYDMYTDTLDDSKIPFGTSPIQAKFYLIAPQDLKDEFLRCGNFWHSAFIAAKQTHVAEFGMAGSLRIILTKYPREKPVVSQQGAPIYKMTGVWVQSDEDVSEIIKNPPRDRSLEMRATLKKKAGET